MATKDLGQLVDSLNRIALEVSDLAQSAECNGHDLAEWTVLRRGKDFVSVYLEVLDVRSASPVYSFTVRDFDSSRAQSRYPFAAETVSINESKRCFRRAMTVALYISEGRS